MWPPDFIQEFLHASPRSWNIFTDSSMNSIQVFQLRQRETDTVPPYRKSLFEDLWTESVLVIFFIERAHIFELYIILPMLFHHV